LAQAQDKPGILTLKRPNLLSMYLCCVHPKQKLLALSITHQCSKWCFLKNVHKLGTDDDKTIRRCSWRFTFHSYTCLCTCARTHMYTHTRSTQRTRTQMHKYIFTPRTMNSHLSTILYTTHNTRHHTQAAAAAAVERAAAAAARAAQAEARKAATAEAAAAGLPNPYPPKPRAKPKAKPPPAEGEAAAPKKRAPYSGG